MDSTLRARHLILAILSVIVLAALVGIRLDACDPEPGPQHYPPPEAPPVMRGYFEVISMNSGLVTNQIRSLLLHNELLLVGTEGCGLLIGRSEEAVFTQYCSATNPPFPADTVTTLYAGSNPDKAWAGTPNGIIEISGLVEGSLSFHLINTGDNKSPRNILALAPADDNGGFWIGTSQGGARMIGKMVAPLSLREPQLTTGLTAVAAGTDGAAFFGGADGLFTTLGASLEKVPGPSGPGFGWIHALLPVGNELYIGSSRGLFRRVETRNDELLPGVWITALANTPGVTEFFGTATAPSLIASPSIDVQVSSVGARLAELDEQLQALNGRYYELMQSFDPRDPNWDAYFADFNAVFTEMTRLNASAGPSLVRGLWVGTQDQGVVLFSNDGQRYHLTNANSRLPSNRITAITVGRDGEAWIGTHEGGLLHYRAQLTAKGKRKDVVWNGQATVLRVIERMLFIGTEEDGLVQYDVNTLQEVVDPARRGLRDFHKKVTDVAVDRKGRIWVTGNAGVWVRDNNTWYRFKKKDGLAAEFTDVVEVDVDGRIYVAGGREMAASAQISQYNGHNFTNYGLPQLTAILGLRGASSTEQLKAMCLDGTYLHKFDTANASAAVKSYDANEPQNKVTTLVGTPHYLLIGTADGAQTIFDGAAFRRLSQKGTGKLSGLLRMRRTPSGRLVLAATDRILTFDGETYRPATPAEPPFDRYTDMCLDDLNPETFWVSYSANSSGAVALYQDPLWKTIKFDSPVRHLAVSDPYLFAAVASQVVRIVRR